MYVYTDSRIFSVNMWKIETIIQTETDKEKNLPGYGIAPIRIFEAVT
jgi:hypothetical protein